MTGGTAPPSSLEEIPGKEEKEADSAAGNGLGKPGQRLHPQPAATGMATYPASTEGPRPLALHEAIPPAAQSRPAPAPPGQTNLADTSHLQHSLQVIGQFDDLYILCQNSEGLVVIDQHAAHERLLFEDLRRQYCRERIASQHLLFPLTVELTLFQAQLVEKNLDELVKMGFALGHFGGNSYVVSAIPALAGQCDAEQLLLDILEQFGNENSTRPRENRFDTILASMACRAAVKAGVSLTATEIEALLVRMAKANLFSHCPHGRPVWKIFSRAEVKKWFHRS
jgi:DNA mismatch repair protein MutL